MLGRFELDSAYCGNCVDLMREMPKECIDLTVTSPPYDNLRLYNGYEFDYKSIIKELWRVTKVGGVVVWIVADQTKNGSESGTSFQQALYFKFVGFNLHDTMIYEQIGTGAKGSNLSYWQGFEYMFVLSKGKPNTVNRIADIPNKNVGHRVPGRFRENGNNEKKHEIKEVGIRTNVWKYFVGIGDHVSDKTGHPAPFPESLANDHIISWSNPDDLVLDPMCGSGTTLKMAKLLGRRYIGFDISQEYCDIARERVEKAQRETDDTQSE